MINIKEKVSKAIEIDRRMKADKKVLDTIKAELQAAALTEMDNKNLKSIEYFSDKGSSVILYKEKLEVDNLPALKKAVGNVIEGNIKIEETVKITVENDKLKKALIAFYTGQYKQHNIKEILRDLYLDKEKTRHLDDEKIKVALKKLKGEYKADKELLERLGVEVEIEEELDAIREQKNYELIIKFFDLEKLDIEKVKQSISVEETLSIGLNYE